MNLPIKKALTFRASSIGDCLMGKYLLENIHVQFPNARLGIVVASRGKMIRNLFAGYPWLEVIETNRHDVPGLWRLWKRFHGSDLVVTQYAGKHGGQFGLASKIAARLLACSGGLVGFCDVSPWNTFLYNQILRVHPEKAVAEHEREVLRAAGLLVSIPYPRLNTTPNPAALPTSLVPGKYIVVHFFAGNAGRSIGLVQARAILEQLQKTLPDVHLVLSGGPSERPQAEKIAGGFLNVITIAGNVSLQDMMQIVLHGKGVLSVDTGIAHIAAQLGKPLVVMRTCLGPNWWSQEQYGPDASIQQLSREDLCTPHIAQDYPRCLSAIDVDVIAAAVRAMM